MPKFRHLSYMLIRVYNGSHLINDILHYFALEILTFHLVYITDMFSENNSRK